MSDRQAAIAEGRKTYTGKVCTKHPELNGERRTTSGGCLSCGYERSRIALLEPVRRARYDAKRKAWFNGDPRRRAYPSMRTRAHKLGVPLNVERWQDLPPCPDYCPCCGTKIVKGNGRILPTSPSIDRTIPERGYVHGNITWMCQSCNSVKGRRDAQDNV